jgi:hypothetical protein
MMMSGEQLAAYKKLGKAAYDVLAPFLDDQCKEPQTFRWEDMQPLHDALKQADDAFREQAKPFFMD